MKKWFRDLFRAINMLPEAMAQALERYAYDMRSYREQDGAYYKGYADGNRDGYKQPPLHANCKSKIIKKADDL